MFAEYEKLVADKLAKEKELEEMLELKKEEISLMEYSDRIKGILVNEVSLEINEHFAIEIRRVEEKIELLDRCIVEVEDVFRDMEDELQNDNNQEENLFQDNTDFMN